jgi:hypothetical protein
MIKMNSSSNLVLGFQPNENSSTDSPKKVEEVPVPFRNGGTYCIPFGEIKEYFDEKKEKA